MADEKFTTSPAGGRALAPEYLHAGADRREIIGDARSGHVFSAPITAIGPAPIELVKPDP
jgi:hypothetical protein